MPDIFDLTNLRIPEGQSATDIQRRLRKGHGELVEVKWDDLENDEKVERTTKYYVGKATMGQTGTIISVIAAVFANGADLKRITGRQDNLLFIQALDEDNMAVLLGSIMGETEEWVKENFALDWVFELIATFLRYNDFFALVEKAMNLMDRWGWTGDKLRGMVTGQAADLKSEPEVPAT